MVCNVFCITSNYDVCCLLYVVSGLVYAARCMLYAVCGMLYDVHCRMTAV